MTNLAIELWSNPKVAYFIHKDGAFTKEDCLNRLKIEKQNFETYRVQYFPIFLVKNKQFVGACGLRPTDKINIFEFGIHLLPNFWHKGLAFEASSAILNYAFNDLEIYSLIAGHNPNNKASKILLMKLGFKFVKNEFYAPTGLEHPTYILSR